MNETTNRESDVSDARPRRKPPAVLETFGAELVRAGAAYSSRPYRRIRSGVLAATVVAAVATGGLATASLVDNAGDPLEIGPDETVTIGFKNASTGETIVCPDGEPLTRRIVSGSEPSEARCADGSVPPAYTEAERRWEDFETSAPPLTAVGEAPAKIVAFEIDESS